MDEAQTEQTAQTNTQAAAQADSEPAWAKQLAASLQKLESGVTTLADYAQRQPATTAAQAQEVEVDEPASVLEDAQLEMLPRRDLVRRLEESFEERLNTALKPIAEAISKTGVDLQAERYTRDAMEVARSKPDFAFWEKEMMAIAQTNPTMPMGDIYLLARAKHPDKAGQVDRDLAAKAAIAKPAEPAARRPLAFTPASGNAAVTNQKMGPQEAAEDAWAKSVAMFGDLFKDT